MNVKHIDLDEDARVDVARRAHEAREALVLARTLLTRAGYAQTRFDQYQHPGTRVMVETGYTYGETRLVVHGHKGDSPEATDLRLVGGEHQNRMIRTFENLIHSGR